MPSTAATRPRSSDDEGPWRRRAQAEFTTIEWVDWYNVARLHSEIGHVPSAERQVRWHAQNPPATMADIK